MKIKWHKVHIAIVEQNKLPRKAKKALFGTRMKKYKLKSLLDSVTIGTPSSSMFVETIIKPYAFCPRCGCTLIRHGGTLASYPEYWEYTYCARCNNVVGYIDNSPFIHALECKDNNYNPVF